jgi:putative ABC transport system permease protein
MGMYKNYFKTAFRNLLRNKVFSGINILGLALGLAVFILIMLWVRSETGYDNFHKDADRTAAVMINKYFDNGETQTFPAAPPPLAAALQKEVPEVEYATSTSWGDARQFTSGDKNFSEYGLYVSPQFLKVFSFPLVSGNADKVLKEPHTVLITETLAKKYFGNENPVGKLITVEQSVPYKVEGVLKDIPGNSTMRFDFLMPMKDYVEYAMEGVERWDNNNVRTYVRLKPGIDRKKLDAGFKHILTKFTDQQPKTAAFLWDMKDWYLRYDFKDGKYAGGGRIVYVRMFIIIGFFILLLACINFMNLSTARAAQRAKEVGVRKVIGAGKASLVKQFISESVLLSVLAGIIAMVLVAAVLPLFNDFLRKKITIDFTDAGSMLTIAGIVLITGLLAGSYPAFVLSAFRPVKVLKNVLTAPAGNAGLRKVLVVIQFTVSVLLITGTIIVSQQVNYVQNRDLGYKKENLIWFQNNIPAEKNAAAIRDIRQVQGVMDVSPASITFTSSNNRGTSVSWPGKKEGQDIFFSFISGGNDIVQTMGMSVKEGRGFLPDNKADTGTVLLNEEAVKRMGLKNPVGTELELYSGKVVIAGVVKDFHFESLHNPVAPAVIMCRPDWTWLMYARLDAKNIPATIAGIEKVYQRFAPGFVFDYNFQDKEYERLYRSEQQVGTLVNWFAFLAVFISCLGLLGLTVYMVERKKKEIGIRKVLGASVAGITTLVSKQFIWLVVLSIAIAAGPAYYCMHNWLSGFAYHIDISWQVFVLSGVLVAITAMLTVGLQALSAAIANPVKSLRTE